MNSKDNSNNTSISDTTINNNKNINNYTSMNNDTTINNDTKPKILSMDIETFSDIDLGKCGVYKYSESPNFEILLLAYAFDDEPVKIVDIACGEAIPSDVLEAIDNPEITKVAYNAQFERVCIGSYLGKTLNPEFWECTMVQASFLTLPFSLESCAEVLKTGAQKDKSGKDLIKYFSIPCKPTKVNGGRTRNLPEHAPEKWQRFKDYCLQDVETERAIRKRISAFPIPKRELEYYHMDQRINDRGVLIDTDLVKQAIVCDTLHTELMTEKAYSLTGLDNPNSVTQLKGWLEARVLSWLAGEEWRLEVFRTHGKIYEASAAAMFNVPIDSIKKGDHLRQKGKVSELACGFSGGVGALIAMGALDMGVKEEELQGLIDTWREANPKIVKLWYEVEKAAKDTIRTGVTNKIGRIKFEYNSGALFIVLPSDRKLVYLKPKLQPNRFGRMGITFECVGSTNKWERQETYYGRLVENITQAVARDLLAEAMLRLEKAGYEIVGSVHDEVIAEVPVDKGSAEDMCRIMSQNPSWADGLPLNADGYECIFYQKS